MAKLLLGLLLVLVIIGTGLAEDCEKDAQDLNKFCKKFLAFPAEPKINPSSECCAVWLRADVPCLCKKVTKKVEKMLSMEKAVYVAKHCKKPFAPGYQCGSFKVPA